MAVSFGGLDGLLNVEPLEVDEGGNVSLVFNTSNAIRFLSDSNVGLVKPTLKASLLVPPERGTICLRRQCEGLRYFTNEQLNDGSIDRNKRSFIFFMPLIRRQKCKIC